MPVVGVANADSDTAADPDSKYSVYLGWIEENQASQHAEHFAELGATGSEFN